MIFKVNCRIGSLETMAVMLCRSFWVNCRIGSLEILRGEVISGESGELPHRQLRKLPDRKSVV